MQKAELRIRVDPDPTLNKTGYDPRKTARILPNFDQVKLTVFFRHKSLYDLCIYQ